MPDTLHSKSIHYRWKFPFCFSASTQGRTALLRVPEYLQPFCNTLGIPVMDVPNWYAEFHHTTTRREPRREEPMDAQDTRFRRQLSSSGSRSHTATRGSHNSSSPTEITAPKKGSKRQLNVPQTPLNVNCGKTCLVCSSMLTTFHLSLVVRGNYYRYHCLYYT